MKKRIATTLLAGLMAASVAMPALASGTTPGGSVPVGTGTEVWAGIIIDDLDAKVKVEVPTLFAFVVNGTVTGAAGGVSSADGTIYLPNVKVDVTTPSTPAGTGAEYTLLTEGNLAVAGKLPFTNYSTWDNGGVREGLEVKINGNIKNEGDAASRKYWTHTTSTDITSTTADFKKYNISIDGEEFDTVANGGLQMADGITLAAPDTNGGADVDVSGYANEGAIYHAAFDVAVGGLRVDYSQIEESAKIGNIVWTISVEMEGDYLTAPNADYLEPS